MASYNNTTIKQMTYNGQKVKKWYHDGVKVFSAGNVVTYYVNSGTSYQEEVDSEASCLSPKTFTPAISGWTFVGWREDNVASSSVLSSRVMGDEAIALYAVFKRTLTATFSGNGATSGSVASISGTQYYNNGNAAHPSITLPANGFTRTSYAFNGWSLGKAGTVVVISSNVTVTAQWIQSVYNYGYTGGMQSFTAPDTGTYQLEVWGAEGGTNGGSLAGTPGKGGYGKGNVDLTKGAVIYICVGGSGTRSTGGYVTAYNGGGASFGGGGPYYGGGGGGATHMGTRNGTLAQYGNTSGLYIVAGGGGGGGRAENASTTPPNGGVLGHAFLGGDGGGSTGLAGYNVHYSGCSTNGDYKAGEGGTQTGAGKSVGGGGGASFGQGGGSASDPARSGGGGGLYGGGGGWIAAGDDDWVAGAGGGSGYIGGVNNGTWSTGARSGDGYARVTMVSRASDSQVTMFQYTGGVQSYTAPASGTEVDKVNLQTCTVLPAVAVQAT